MTRNQSRSLFLSAALLVSPLAYAGVSAETDPAIRTHDPGEAQVGRTDDLQPGDEVRAGAPSERDAAGWQAGRGGAERTAGSGGRDPGPPEAPRSRNFTDRELDFIQQGP